MVVYWCPIICFSSCSHGEFKFHSHPFAFLTSLANEGQPLSHTRADLPYVILYYPWTGCGGHVAGATSVQFDLSVTGFSLWH